MNCFKKYIKTFCNSIVINLVNLISYDDITFYLKFYNILFAKYSFTKYLSYFQKTSQWLPIIAGLWKNKKIDLSLSAWNIYIIFHKSILFLIFSQMPETRYNFSTPEYYPL